MDALVPYTFEGRELRAFARSGEPWFVAGDVAAFLGYEHTPHLTRLLEADEKGVHSVDTPGGTQEVVIVSEPGLYRVMAKRRATTAVPTETREFIGRFQRWLFHDVLPSLRRTGSYTVPHNEPPPVTAREVRLQHKHFLGIAKLAGLSGNQLLIAANRATKRGTGVDVLASMGISELVAPVADPLVVPTKLGQDLGGVGPAQVNRLLEAVGLQLAERDHKQRLLWRPTSKGVSLGAQVVDVERDNDTGAAQQLKWPLNATLTVLREFEATQNSKH